MVLSYDIDDGDVLVSADGDLVGFLCTLRELSTASAVGAAIATTPAMSRVRFRGARIAEMALVLDVLGFARHIAALRDAVSKSPAQTVASSVARGSNPLAPPGVGVASAFTIHDFEVLRYIGHGAFGKVWLARERASGARYALKAMAKDVLRRAVAEKNTVTTWKRAVAESQLHTALPRHPFVVECHGAFQNDEVGRSARGTARRVCGSPPFTATRNGCNGGESVFASDGMARLRAASLHR